MSRAHSYSHNRAHSPTFPSLHLRHSLFSNTSVASPTSQLILQSLFHFSYATGSSLTSPGEPPIEQFFFPQTEQLQSNIRFQQDGAPPHWFNEVRTTLDNIFPGRWIDRGPIAWPPISPDLTQLDFILWGYVEDTVHDTTVRDLRGLRERIKEVIESISEDMLQCTWQEIVHRQ